MGLDLFDIGIGAIGVIAILIAVVYRLVMAIAVGLNKVKLERNALMLTLLTRIEQGAISSLYINNDMVCFNFGITKHTTTTTTTYSNGQKDVQSSVKHTCKVDPANIIDFNKLGYQSIRSIHLRQYKRQLMEKIVVMPHVVKVERCGSMTFEPANFIICDGEYGKQPRSNEEAWVIQFQHIGAKAAATGNGRKLG